MLMAASCYFPMKLRIYTLVPILPLHQTSRKEAAAAKAEHFSHSIKLMN